MYDDNEFSAATIRENHVDAGDKTVDTTIAHARAVIDANRICVVRNFPTDPDTYLTFLRGFGTPLANYSSRSDLAKDDPHPQINRVKYKPKGEYVKHSVHYVGGELRPHSARSWCTPRPAFFAMLMVDPGWRDTPPGERGESVVLNWRYLFEQLAARDGDVFAEHFARLTGTPIKFEANNVREELSDLPLCYPLPDSSGAYDIGVRLKQDLPDKLRDQPGEIPDMDKYLQSVDYLAANAGDEKFQACFPMDRGDLLLLDNNRFAHGRRKIIGQRTVNDARAVNPRELWSVTVA
jgi:alpha-ketoglutarate-dependent taurine dioxygenase